MKIICVEYLLLHALILYIFFFLVVLILRPIMMWRIEWVYSSLYTFIIIVGLIAHIRNKLRHSRPSRAYFKLSIKKNEAERRIGQKQKTTKNKEKRVGCVGNTRRHSRNYMSWQTRRRHRGSTAGHIQCANRKETMHTSAWEKLSLLLSGAQLTSLCLKLIEYITLIFWTESMTVNQSSSTQSPSFWVKWVNEWMECPPVARCFQLR